ncbi:MAG TPA: hypothetical protein VGG83_10695 [Trebonia sp.]|jgi:hypothetical protein
MRIRPRHLTPLLATTAVLATTAAACGSSGPTPAEHVTTNISIQNPGSAKKCTMTLRMLSPQDKQLTASLTVTCDFPVASMYTTLVIQGRPTGSGDTAWQNVDEPATTADTPPAVLTFTYNCVTGYDFQASASIDGSGADGSPFTATQTTTPRSYGASECSGK